MNRARATYFDLSYSRSPPLFGAFLTLTYFRVMEAFPALLGRGKRGKGGGGGRGEKREKKKGRGTHCQVYHCLLVTE